MRLIMKKLFQLLFFTFFIFTLTLTTFSCANIIDALKEAFPPPGKSGENIQNENTEPEKPNTDGNNQGGNSGGSDTLKPVESYPYKSTVNITITGLDEGTYFIEPLFFDTASTIENIISYEKSFNKTDNSYTFGLEENETLIVVFDFKDMNTKKTITQDYVELQPNQILEKKIEIIDYNTSVNIVGDYGKYNNPKFLILDPYEWDIGTPKKVYNINSNTFTVSTKCIKEYGLPYFVLFNDTDNDNDYRNFYTSRISNNDDYSISNKLIGVRETEDSTNLTVNLEIFDSATLLPSLLDESQFIKIIHPVEYNPSDETTKHYRFEKTKSRWTFLIPAGTGSDGEFITCYFCENNLGGHSGDHLWNLLNTIGILHDEEFKNAERNQTTEWHNYIKQIITYLQDEKGLTVNNIPDFLQD